MSAVKPSTGVSAEPQLLLQWDVPTAPSHWARVGTGSLAIHAALILIAVLLGRVPSPPPRVLRTPDRASDLVKLVAPIVGDLTQRAPNKGRVSKEFDLASLPPRPESSALPRPGAAAPPREVHKFKAPAPTPGAAAPSAPLPETLAPDVPQLRAQGPLPSIGVPAGIAPPPQIVAEEKPKLAFEKLGASTGTLEGLARVPAPKASIEDAMRQAARGAGSRGISVGDEDESAIALTPGVRPGPTHGRLGSSVDLLSDPQGADFIPYLRAVLSAVRRNWYAIIPESARMGRTGRVGIQFAIDRTGNLSKIVIASPSGARELDLAAVAGVTASNPFPPLPTNFKGTQIRLQFAFRYSTSAR